MRKQTDTDVELVESSGGVFEVKVDGKLVHSKKETGDFPGEELLLEKIRGLRTDD